MVIIYKKHYFLAFITASNLPQEVKELKGNIRHFKTDLLGLNWVDSCSREACSDRNPLFKGKDKRQTQV